MKYTNNEMSVILLYSYLGIKKGGDVKPFTLGEWNRFVENLGALGKEPSVVFEPNMENALVEMGFISSEVERVKKLIARGGIVAFELEELERKGIKVITRFDGHYPLLLKKRLNKKAPPVLFYAGDIELSGKIGIAVVGSRNIDEEGIMFTKELVKKASDEKLVVYSGGAKGVDSISEKTAIDSGGAAVSFIADSLTTRIKNREVVLAVQQKKLLLISDVKPDVGFTAARAMNRNKYIYAASCGAFVVAADFNKGGTWTGAMENIRKNWTKTFVWDVENYSGNQELIRKGGISFHHGKEKIFDIIRKKEIVYSQIDLFKVSQTIRETDKHVKANVENINYNDIYYIVEEFIINQFKDELSLDEACNKINIAKGQMKEWMKRLIKEGKIVKQKGSDKYKAKL